ncbi:DEAD/DEAH box helicase family protein [Streptomyces cyaneofuscatus]|uniref:DEAD/DEAH box helicase family protein n=1 Tax=Streptomyces cyaneofuscatus TaxID=66883 RepID=UPI002953B6CE|nr:DEAD/DEAH box helicase family protein [Streptomyces cyaneofuscatus]WOP10666.1 DEAD/DEAH box helicase family protein [Streptomyces cyaneofuscatus]
MAEASEASRDRRRAFNSAERVALFLAADGRCTACRQELDPGWHGDHMQPWSAGGPTEVTNGQALCPECNLKKGQGSMADVFGLREWQQEARERYHGRDGGTGGSFLVVATPGAGKTTFALTIARDLIDQGVIDKIVVIVPTAHLRRQWSGAASRNGVQLDHRFVNANGVIGRDFDGAVVTYQTVTSEPQLWRKLCSVRRTLVIFDEIHHAGEGDDQRWGLALKSAFDVATRRLLLSGTPFRTDGTPIPFVEYEDKRAVPGYNYDYGMALADGGVVRPAVFPAMDGEAKWRRAGRMPVTTVALADTDEKTVPPALKAALDPNGEWIPSVLQEADAALTQARIDTPDAGGLVVAFDQNAARAYASILERITGERPAIAVSDEPDSSKIIEKFKDDDSRWIVAVQMVAEGVDIPRLAVGVYATRVRTQMFFIQVVGRFVRMRGEEDETTARLFIPSIQPLLSYAQAIEKTVDAVLADEEKRVREIQEGDGNDPDEPPSLLAAFETVGSSAAVHHTTIASGESITPEEMTYAKTVMSRAGSAPRGMSTEYVALILRTAGVTSAVPTQRPAPAEAPPLADQKYEVKKLLKRKVGRYSIATDKPHQFIHGEMNRHFGDNSKTATLDSLLKRIELLDRWLKEV